MRRFIFCFVAALAIGTPAAAQVNTDCTQTLLGMSCQTYDPNAETKAWAALLGAIARENREEEARAAALQAEQARIAQQQQFYLQQQAALQQQELLRQQAYVAEQQELAFLGIVSQAIQAGECEDAKAIALGRNRLDVADQAARLCKPKKSAVKKSYKPRRRK